MGPKMVAMGFQRFQRVFKRVLGGFETLYVFIWFEMFAFSVMCPRTVGRTTFVYKSRVKAFFLIGSTWV